MPEKRQVERRLFLFLLFSLSLSLFLSLSLSFTFSISLSLFHFLSFTFSLFSLSPFLFLSLSFFRARWWVILPFFLSQSLLNVLCGRANYGTTTGIVRINGEVRHIQSLASIVGFVPQDDIVHDTLTVHENLLFSALFRGDRKTSLEHLEKLVNETLRVLLLDHVRNSIVGSVEKRGISGGQRKRVNIGLEVAAEPAVIFLDEPTSGLDATSSQLIMGALAKLGHIGITTASVIHQPRYDVFCGFSLLFLLGKGGKMVYQGPPAASKRYFEMIGFDMQPTENVAVTRTPTPTPTPIPTRTLTRTRTRT